MLYSVMPLINVLPEGEAAGTDVGGMLSTATNAANAQIQTALTTVVPVALTLLGIVLAIRIGVGVYKSIANKASK